MGAMHLRLCPRQIAVLGRRLDRYAQRAKLSPRQLARLQRCLLPEEYGERPTGPTALPPGSADKVSLLARRLARGEALFAPGDAAPVEGRPPPVFALMVRLAAGDYLAAVEEAKRLLGVRPPTGQRGGRGTRLPSGASVEAL